MELGMVDTRIKPCPFCGSTDVLMVTPADEKVFEAGRLFVMQCKRCYAEGPRVKQADMQQALQGVLIYAWNNRG